MGGDDVNVQATLHYIDKVYAARIEAARALNRAVLFTLFVSLSLSLSAIGLIKPPHGISVLGMHLRASFAVLLVSGVVLVSCLMVYIRALILRMWALYEELPRLYSAINFVHEDKAMQDSLTSPFLALSYGRLLRAPLESKRYLAKSFVVHWYEKLTFGFVMVAIVAFPVLAELAASIRVVRIIEVQNLWSWELLLFLPLCFFIICITCITAISPKGRFSTNAAPTKRITLRESSATGRPNQPD